MISLNSSILTCKVDTANAARLDTDRFLNPSEMVCPVWSGYDSTGRKVCPDSYLTKKAGCHSASDRVIVENDLRPKYSQYVTLDASGLEGTYDQHPSHKGCCDGKSHSDEANEQTGNFGLELQSYTYPKCCCNQQEGMGPEYTLQGSCPGNFLTLDDLPEKHTSQRGCSMNSGQFVY